MRSQILEFQKSRALKNCLVATSLMLVAGCTGVIPASAPSGSDIRSVPSHQPSIRLVDVDPNVIEAMQAEPELPLTSVFGNAHPGDTAIGVGDILQVTIFESGGVRLFSGGQESTNPGSNAESLPQVTVDSEGRVALPYVGVVEVAGKTPLEAGQILEQRFEGKAVQPQVIVSVMQNRANIVLITGAVKSPGQYPLVPGGATLLQAVASAGVVSGITSNTVVQVSRDGKTVDIPMQVLVDHPEQNIYVKPGDIINVVDRPSTYTVFGAAGKQDEYPIGFGGVSLAQALARAGGLRDIQADPTSVFVLRYESPQILSKLNAQAKKPVAASPANNGQEQPIVYEVNLNTAEGFFLAQKMPVHDRDLVLIANASSVQWQKILDLFRLTISGPAQSVGMAAATDGMM